MNCSTLMTQYPPCLIANEVGVIAIQTKDGKAVHALCEMLNDSRVPVQYQ